MTLSELEKLPDRHRHMQSHQREYAFTTTISLMSFLPLPILHVSNKLHFSHSSFVITSKQNIHLIFMCFLEHCTTSLRKQQSSIFWLSRNKKVTLMVKASLKLCSCIKCTPLLARCYRNDRNRNMSEILISYKKNKS